MRNSGWVYVGGVFLYFPGVTDQIDCTDRFASLAKRRSSLGVKQLVHKSWVISSPDAFRIVVFS